MRIRPLLAAGLLACGLSAQATTIALVADGSWNPFDVSIDQAPHYNLNWVDINDGSPLSFSFSVADGFVGRLTVVDAVFSGDVFSVVANGVPLANTSPALNSYPDGNNVGYDYAAALLDGNYSRGFYTFGAGSYTLTGALVSSAVDELGVALNATNGALSLTVSPVPETSTLASLLAGLGGLALLRRRFR